MSSKQPIWRWRLFLFWSAVVVIAGLLACFIRPLNTLGYEYALFISLIASLGAGHLAACYPYRIRNQLARFPGARFPGLIMYYRALLFSLPLVLLPLAIAFLSSQLEPPCNQLEGIRFYVALPTGSIIIAVAIGLLAGSATPGAKTASTVWFILYLATFAGSIYTFYSSPAVYVFGPLFGYIPGVLYDELVHFELRLGTYRVITLIQTAGLLAFINWFLDPAELKLSLKRALGKPKSSLVFVVLFTAAVAAYLAGPTLGHRTTREALEQTLTYNVSDGKLSLFFPPDTDPQLVDSLYDDTVFSLHQVERYLDLTATGQIAVFFFKTSEQRGAAMGAGSTTVAKPWRREIYATLSEPPHSVLRHELVHAVTAQIGQGPFQVAGILGGFLPNPGLIEGIAVAAEGPGKELTTHQWSAAMLKLKILPELDNLFGLSFLGRNAPAAYTTAGSFCDWIRHRFGAAALKEAYQHGSFETATKQTLDALEQSWHDFLSNTPLEEEDLVVARHRFDRPATLEKTCVHEVARLNRDAARYAKMKQWDKSLHLYNEAYRKSGESPRARMRLFYALVDSDRPEAMQREAVALLGSSALTRVQKDVIQEILADHDVTDFHFQEAKRAFADLALTAPGESIRRALEVKTHLAGLADKNMLPVLRILARRPKFHDTWPAKVALTISAAAHTYPDSPLFAYLLARQYYQVRNFDTAILWLKKAEELGLERTTSSLWLAAQMLLGRASFYAKDFLAAKTIFHKLEEDESIRRGARAIAADWKERCEFFEH